MVDISNTISRTKVVHLVLQIITAAHAFEKAAVRVFRPHGLTPARFNVLNVLSSSPGGMRASDLASTLIVDPSNVTGLLKRMRKENLVAELENSGDRREHIVCLSPKGRALWSRAMRDYERRLRELGALVRSAEAEAAEKVLRVLVEHASRIP
jgi:DNA-binding MarR family transcriptional regulator